MVACPVGTYNVTRPGFPHDSAAFTLRKKATCKGPIKRNLFVFFLQQVHQQQGLQSHRFAQFYFFLNLSVNAERW